MQFLMKTQKVDSNFIYISFGFTINQLQNFKNFGIIEVGYKYIWN
jgi:hypothetical protein